MLWSLPWRSERELTSVMLRILAIITAAASCTSIGLAEDHTDLRPGVRPKHEVHLYLLIGQSNMAGRGRVEEADRVRHPRVFSFNQERKWVPGIDPLHSDRANAGVGLGTSFGRVMADANPGVTIGLIPSAVGGTRLERWEKGSDLWQQATERARAAQQFGQLKGVLWHQGEADGLKRETAQTYAERLARMVVDFRDELHKPALPFVAGKLGEFLPDNRNGLPWYWPLVNEQIATVPNRVEHTAVVESSGLSHLGDSVHFDSASLRTFGKRYAEIMQKLQQSD